MSNKRKPTVGDPLTAKELEVLVHLGKGEQAKEIAIKLRRSERTINFHCDNIYTKLGVDNKVQAVVSSLLSGTISLAQLDSLPI